MPHLSHVICSELGFEQVLRKYPDRTVAKDLIAELEGYAGDPNNLVMSSKCPSSLLELLSLILHTSPIDRQPGSINYVARSGRILVFRLL